MATPRAAPGPTARADGARRRPPVTPGRGAQGASWPSSGRAAAAPGRAPLGTTGGGRALARVASRAQEVPGPSPAALQAACGPSTAPRPGCGVPVAHRLERCQAGTGVRRTLVVAPRLPHARAQVPAVHPA
jgi:hypothetical protein